MLLGLSRLHLRRRVWFGPPTLEIGVVAAVLVAHKFTNVTSDHKGFIWLLPPWQRSRRWYVEYAVNPSPCASQLHGSGVYFVEFKWYISMLASLSTMSTD